MADLVRVKRRDDDNTLAPWRFEILLVSGGFNPVVAPAGAFSDAPPSDDLQDKR
ncbi:hypothetical protein [Sorangium sp. So ce1335]|uniref:hypothetical protein n=1 Tax=Sorangium sp. So ce1335 TaxID=3133335 RepID=UPI003F5F3175